MILQNSADNANIIVSTIDGHKTMPIMSVVKIISLTNGVVVDMLSVKCESKTTAGN